MLQLMVGDVRAVAEAIGAATDGCLRMGRGWRRLDWPLAVLDHAREYPSLAKVGSNCADVVLLHDS